MLQLIETDEKCDPRSDVVWSMRKRVKDLVDEKMPPTHENRDDRQHQYLNISVISSSRARTNVMLKNDGEARGIDDVDARVRAVQLVGRLRVTESTSSKQIRACQMPPIMRISATRSDYSRVS